MSFTLIFSQRNLGIFRRIDEFQFLMKLNYAWTFQCTSYDNQLTCIHIKHARFVAHLKVIFWFFFFAIVEI